MSLLRRHGVSDFVGHGIEVRLGLAPATSPASAKPVELGRDPDTCACGHSLSVGHNETGCITGAGCDPALCDADLRRKEGLLWP